MSVHIFHNDFLFAINYCIVLIFLTTLISLTADEILYGFIFKEMQQVDQQNFILNFIIPYIKFIYIIILVNIYVQNIYYM